MGRFKFKLLFVCALVLLLGAPAALGDWDEGDGHKMHYPQLPKEDGWDVAFNFGRLADDWQCSQTGPVEDIHFWVSWEMDMVGPIAGFGVRIWSDDPCGTNGYSEPNELLWERDFDAGDFTVRDMPDGLQQGWFDPFTGFWVYPDHVILQQINIEDINDPFIQKEGEIYWLEIDMWGAVSCGWKESVSPQFRDDAVFWDFPDWLELIDPEIYESMDLAFVITGKEEEVVKWEQPPCLDDPNCMDVDATDDNWMWWAPQALADDFNCTATGLITDIHIWGSWLYDEPPDYDPNHVWFTLCLYSNDPCGPMGWSEPNELLWTKDFHEGDFDVKIFAEGPEAFYIPCEPVYFPDSDWICWQYDFYIDPCEAFVQEEGTIYWLALQAHIYDPMPWEVRFGWKNSSEQWNDDAVWAVGDLPGNLGGWNELRHPMTEESVDLAFKITTIKEEVPPEIKWEQPPCLDDPNCMDVDATDDDWWWWAPQALADDFLCETTGLITDIHIWGSWFYDEPPDYDPNHVWFTLCIYSNDPVGPNGWSEPDELLWTKEFHEGQFSVEIFAEGYEAYYIPCEPVYFPDSDWICWQYDFYIDPCEAFVQEEGTIYWLALQAHIYDPDPMWPNRFGWKNSSEQWNDDAVWAVGKLPGNLGAWNELRHPLTEESVDLAFVITTVEEEEVPAKPAVPHLKWSQPPIEIDPTADTPTYCGWNEPSYREIMAGECEFECWGSDWPYQCHGDADNAVEGKMAYRVYINDLAILAYAWGTAYPDPCYNPCADFDRNLVVGPGDLAILEEWWMVSVVPPNCPPCGGEPAIGEVQYWDLFAVSLSPNDVYWNLVEGGYGTLTDPLVSPDPAGSSVIDLDPPFLGIAWGFGGLAWEDLTLEHVIDANSIELIGEPNYYLSVVLDTSTLPNHDKTLSSWGTISNIVVTPWNAGAWGAPIQPNWVISPFDPDSGTAVTPNSVTLASNDFGVPAIGPGTGAGQPMGIWGAAAELPPADGYKVTFDANVFTWDSYDAVGPQPGALPSESWQVVADDFRCLGPMPITSIHWWGSYLGWEDSEPPEIEPEAWRIGFWSNVPAGLNADYSYPEELLWQVEVRIPRVEIEYVGEDYYPDNPPESCFQYHVELLLDECFWQYKFLDQTMDDTFWISIAAIYPSDQTADPCHLWGWKTRPWSWMDDAVRFWMDEEPQPGMVLDPGGNMIQPIEDPCGESVDVAFELDTDPNYIKWEQAFTGIRHWPHYEDELSMATVEPTGEPNISRLVADDWRCDQNTPVTAAVWWGSYIGYRYAACDFMGPWMPLPVPPKYFWLTIWDDIPAGYAKWTQLPDPDGWDVCVVCQWVADDFNCTETGPVTDIHFWTSWLDDIVGDVNLSDWDISIWSDAAGQPGVQLWTWNGLGNVTTYHDGTGDEGWICPSPPPWIVPHDHQNYYKVDIDNIQDPFIQVAGNVYWLVIRAWIPAMPSVGWKTSVDDPPGPLWGNPALWSQDLLNWMVVDTGAVDPELHDMAFEITTGPSYSHPNDILWEYKAYDYDEVLVGYDKHPEDPDGQGREPVFRYSVRLPDPNWFCQDANDGIYWFSVVAVYEDVPDYNWGWTNHEHVYNDDAVAGYLDASGEWTWEELYDQTEVNSVDMSFVLFTACFPCTHPDYSEWLYVGKPNCWCYPRQCHGDADGLPFGKNNYWVAIPDLTILKSAWQKTAAQLVGNEACADFDHLPFGKNDYRVAIPDLTILKTNWQIPNGPDPNCFAGY